MWKQLTLALALALACALGAAAPAMATPMPAPAKPAQPAKPVAPGLFSGRWYEIARTPNSMQRGCEATTTDFTGWRAGAFKVVQTCNTGAPGNPRVLKVDGKVVPASQNAKIKLAMLGGLLSQEYWILDHAADNQWLIMSTANQRYVWLMSRAPVLSAAEKASALGRLQQLGFNLGRLAFPQQDVASR